MRAWVKGQLGYHQGSFPQTFPDTMPNPGEETGGLEEARKGGLVPQVPSAGLHSTTNHIVYIYTYLIIYVFYSP